MHETDGAPKPKIRPVTTSDIEPIVQLLNENWPKTDFWPMFQHKWLETKPSFGFVLVNNGDIVGFVGTIYSTRYFDGEPRRYCNISSWYVRKEFRSHSISLLLVAYNQTNATVTVFTPNHISRAVVEAEGFNQIEKCRLIVPPVLNALGLFSSWRAEITSQPDAIKEHLGLMEARVFSDNDTPLCKHYLISLKRDKSYVVVRKGHKFRGIPAGKILHVSNPSLFSRCIEMFVAHLIWHDRIFILDILSRYLSDNKVRAIKRPARQYIRSEGDIANFVDELYSEFVLLGQR